MKALVFDKELKLINDYKKPVPQKGEALVRVTMAGICNTDFEITKGYMGYVGILGHEAVGIVEDVNSDDKSLIGKRVVPEISYGCKDPNCEWCAVHNYRHCPNRHTLGIFHKDGVFANFDVTLVGKHQNKLDIAKAQGIKTALLNEFRVEKIYDVVVEATGSVSGFETSLALTKPRGTLVLKSTVAASKEFNLAPIVIDEITVLGSRCGKFPPALRLLKSGKVDFSPLISGMYDFDDALKAFEKNKQKDTLKVLLKF